MTQTAASLRVQRELEREEEELKALMLAHIGKKDGETEDGDESEQDQGTEAPDANDESDAEAEPVETDTKSEEAHDVDTKETKGKDHDWEKRFKDAQRHITELTTKLKNLEKTGGAKMPTDPDKIKAWMDQNPVATEILKTIVADEIKETKETVTKIAGTMSKEAATRLLKAAHPDFETYKGDKDFIKWAKESPEEIQALLFSSKGLSPEGVEKVSWLLDTYKRTVKKTKESVESSKDGIRETTKRGARSSLKGDDSKYDFKMSDIEKMSDREFEAIVDKFDEARAAGRVLFDTM